jgi:hypothetical protein
MRALLHGCVLLVLLTVSCAKAPEPSDEGPVERNGAIGAWLSTVRAAHAAADGANTLELRRQTLTVLRMLASGAAPEALPSTDTNNVRRALYAHAARMALELKYFDLAEELTRDGLALEGEDPFRTQLLILAARAYHVLGHAEAEAQMLQLARKDLGIR